MNYALLTEEIKRNVTAILLSNKDYVYHNLKHTESVVKHAAEIGSFYNLNEQDLFVVTTAAWFHDAGYFTGGQAEHEMRGANMAETFLKGQGFSDEGLILSIKKCILATQFPQSPTNLLEQIVCDADLFHFGTDDFFERNKLIHKEVEIITGKEIGKGEWRRNTIRLLENHHFFTDYCRALLDNRKLHNLEKLKKKESEKKNGHPDKKQLVESDEKDYPLNKKEETDGRSKHEENKGKKKQELIDLVTQHIVEEEKDYSIPSQALEKDIPGSQQKPKKKKRPERGIDTVFRITSNNNQRLSSQADSKAHIMIQVNSIIISVLISMLFRRLEEYRYLVVPAVMLLAANVITIIFSVLATRPQIPSGTFSKQDIDDKKVNLLFFGNFYKMTLEDYASGMLAMMDEYDFLYMSLIRDVYFQGKVLGKKYQLLRVSYNVFMYGLVLSVFAFMVAFVFFSGK